jgi:hypothetical protein
MTAGPVPALKRRAIFNGSFGTENESTASQKLRCALPVTEGGASLRARRFGKSPRLIFRISKNKKF